MCKPINHEEWWEKLRKFIINRSNHFNEESLDPHHGISVTYGAAYMRIMREKMDEIEREE